MHLNLIEIIKYDVLYLIYLLSAVIHISSCLKQFFALCEAISWKIMKILLMIWLFTRNGKMIFVYLKKQFLWQRPYHAENTGSRPITEVKQHWAWLVLRWVTAWEYQVLLPFRIFCHVQCFLKIIFLINTYRNFTIVQYLI